MYDFNSTIGSEMKYPFGTRLYDFVHRLSRILLAPVIIKAYHIPALLQADSSTSRHDTICFVNPAKERLTPLSSSSDLILQVLGVSLATSIIG